MSKECSKPYKKLNGLRQRHISAKDVAKWQPLSKDLKSLVVNKLEESMGRYVGYSDETDEVLEDVHKSTLRVLERLVVPADDLMDQPGMDSLIDKLSDEKERLDAKEKDLTLAVEESKSRVKRLQEEIESLGSNESQSSQ